MELFLIRHGRTMAMPDKICCGRTDVALSPEGIAQLKAMKEAGGYPDLTGLHVYTSGMKRTEQTLAALYGPVAHDVLKDFREIDFGDLEGQVIIDAASCDWMVRTRGDHALAFPHGESWDQVLARAYASVNELLDRNEDALVVTHGGITGMLVADLFPERYGQGTAEGLRALHCGCGFHVTFRAGVAVAVTGLPDTADFTEAML